MVSAKLLTTHSNGLSQARSRIGSEVKSLALEHPNGLTSKYARCKIYSVRSCSLLNKIHDFYVDIKNISPNSGECPLISVLPFNLPPVVQTTVRLLLSPSNEFRLLSEISVSCQTVSTTYKTQPDIIVRVGVKS